MSDLTFANQKSTLMDILSNPKKFAAALTELENAIAAHDKAKAEALAAVELTAPAQEIPVLYQAAKDALAAAESEVAKAQETVQTLTITAGKDAAKIIAAAQERADGINASASEVERLIAEQKQETENNLLESRRLKDALERDSKAVEAEKLELADKAKQLQTAQSELAKYKEELTIKVQQFAMSLNLKE